MEPRGTGWVMAVARMKQPGSPGEVHLTPLGPSPKSHPRSASPTQIEGGVDSHPPNPLNPLPRPAQHPRGDPRHDQGCGWHANCQRPLYEASAPEGTPATIGCKAGLQTTCSNSSRPAQHPSGDLHHDQGGPPSGQASPHLCTRSLYNKSLTVRML